MKDITWQNVVETYFRDYHVGTEAIHEFVYETQLVDYPRMAGCSCTRCQSLVVEKSVKSRSITMKTEKMTYTVYLPGIPETFKHKW